MTNQTRDTIVIFFLVVYNLAIIAGTAYLIQFYDWSAWWFLLSVLLLANTRKKDEHGIT